MDEIFAAEDLNGDLVSGSAASGSESPKPKPKPKAAVKKAAPAPTRPPIKSAAAGSGSGGGLKGIKTKADLAKEVSCGRFIAFDQRN